ncbi:MAG: hypothetical protein IV090_07935 [Candidatus Sericytochromatia bacterium]|nr:hypothetical protein [Candidatus Sericytochromatia bacterium]
MLTTNLLAKEVMMSDEINTIVERLFPERLIDPNTFDQWCRRIRSDIFGDAANLLAKLENWLEEQKGTLKASEQLKRDYWEIFGGNGETLIKTPQSIRSKLARDFKTESITAERKTEEFLRTKILEFSDLGRIRIVTDFFSDTSLLKENMFDATTRFLQTYECPKGIKDFVFDPSMRDGLKGHRAFQFSVRIPLDTETFGFEIQLMTRLQHAWDRHNHPFYEWQRETPNWQGNAKAVELAVNDFACAETLHLVDRQADQNWQSLKNFLQEARSTDE